MSYVTLPAPTTPHQEKAMTTTAVPAPAALTPTISNRRVPRFGGLNPTLLRVELTRLFRDRRRVFMIVVLPAAIYLMVSAQGLQQYPYGNSTVAGVVMVGMALYGAMVSTASVGAAVSVERAAGWSRQLRLTPLSPVAYVAAKAVAGLLGGALSVAAVYACALVQGVSMPLSTWLASAAIVWLGSAIFAAFGLFMGYLLPTDNAMQIIGPMLAGLAILGGLFMPLPDHGIWHTISMCSPMWGIHQLALSPFGAGDFSWGAVASAVVWLAVFVAGAAWRMSRDTARV